MKVIGFVQGTDSSVAATFNHDTGITAAVIACKLASRYNPLASNPVQYLQLFNFASGVVTAQDQAVQIPLNLPINSYKNYAFLVLDVTGL